MLKLESSWQTVGAVTIFAVILSYLHSSVTQGITGGLYIIGGFSVGDHHYYIFYISSITICDGQALSKCMVQGISRKSTLKWPFVMNKCSWTIRTSIFNYLLIVTVMKSSAVALSEGEVIG